MWIEIEMYVLLFFACSFLGWCMEVTCKLVQFGRFINRGFLLGPLCPIYGTGAVLMAYFLPLWTTQVESTFLLALVLCGTLEYITSWLMEKLFHARWWDYSQKHFNINGRVCASNLLAFGVMGVFVVKVLKALCVWAVRQNPARLAGCHQHHADGAACRGHRDFRGRADKDSRRGRIRPRGQHRSHHQGGSRGAHGAGLPAPPPAARFPGGAILQ
ncbi:MAG: putative ABC transporter permease [Christensenellales bacterium]